MISRWSIVVIMLAGCNEVFGVHHTDFGSIDAYVDPVDDEDGDGIPNETDNCPGIFNPLQAGGDRLHPALRRGVTLVSY